MSELVKRHDEGGISTLSFNRPDVLNALSPNLFVEFRNHLDALAESKDSIGVVILKGEGRSFSAGNDLKAIQAGEQAPTPHFQAETLERLESLPQAVIASVRGHCYTGALEVVLACDLLLASETAKFADTHGKWSMTPTWGMSQRLPRRIGPLKAKEMMFSGRVVTGQEAVDLGLANRCLPDEELDQATLKLAAEIAENSWHTLRADKSLVDGGVGLNLAEGLKFERANSPGRGPDMEERLKAFAKK